MFPQSATLWVLSSTTSVSEVLIDLARGGWGRRWCWRRRGRRREGVGEEGGGGERESSCGDKVSSSLSVGNVNLDAGMRKGESGSLLWMDNDVSHYH